MLKMPSKQPRSDQPLQGDNPPQDMLMQLFIELKLFRLAQEYLASAHLILGCVELHSFQKDLNITLGAK